MSVRVPWKDRIVFVCGLLVCSAFLGVAFGPSWASPTENHNAPVVVELKLDGEVEPVLANYIDEGLADYPDQAFDYVILSQTLQETTNPVRVLREMMRVGKWAIVSFPNFGNWRVRLSMLLSGQAPKTKLFPYNWYDSPNIHFLTVRDFEQLAVQEGFRVEQRYFVAGESRISMFPNLMAETAVYLVTR